MKENSNKSEDFSTNIQIAQSRNFENRKIVKITYKQAFPIFTFRKRYDII